MTPYQVILECIGHSADDRGADLAAKIDQKLRYHGLINRFAASAGDRDYGHYWIRYKGEVMIATWIGYGYGHGWMLGGQGGQSGWMINEKDVDVVSDRLPPPTV